MDKVNFDPKLNKLVASDSRNCIGCKLCMQGCPMLDEFAENPKDLLKSLDKDQVYSWDLPYSCMLCGYCEQVCPKGISFKDIFFNMRKLLVSKNGGNIPSEVKASSTNFHQNFSFSKIFTSPIANLNSDIVFFPGCALLADNPKLVDKIYTYLKSIYPGIGFWNACCAKPTKYLGREDKFTERMKLLQKEYRPKGVKRLITACQNCTITFDQSFNDLETIPIYNILAENFPDHAINKFSETNTTINIHDPCPSRYDESLQKSARILAEKLGFVVEELKFSKQKTICCSAGGMVMQTAPEIGIKHMKRRSSEGDKPMLTYCKECVSKLGSRRKISHLLDLIFLDKDQAFKYKEYSTIKSWVNRFKSKRLV